MTVSRKQMAFGEPARSRVSRSGRGPSTEQVLIVMMHEGVKLLVRISKELVERHQKKPMTAKQTEKIRGFRQDLLDLRTNLGEIAGDED